MNIGHSSFIPNVRFLSNDNHLVSIGGEDNSIFIWETDFGKGNEGALDDYDDEDSDDDLIDLDEYIQPKPE